METPRKGQKRPRITEDELCPVGICESLPENSITEQDIESRLETGYRGMPRRAEEPCNGFSEDDNGDSGTIFSFSWELEEETGSLVAEEDTPNLATSSKEVYGQLKTTRLESISQNDRQQLCGVHGKELREVSNLSLQEMIHNGENAYECKVCSEAFSSRPDLETHERAHTGKEPHQQCGVCNKTLVGKMQVLKHHLKHTRRPHKCPVCGKGFRRRRFLRAHEQMHSRDEVFQCDVCEKAFHRRTTLLAHQRTHPGVKPYQCQECGKAFRCAENLKVHEKRHRGERPFQCDFCEKAFSYKTGLVAHIRTHTGEKPYQCDVCGKAFTTRANMTAHRKTHTGEKPHKCEVCGKAFSMKATLKVHERTHTGEKPHKCEVCGKAFSLKATLTDHKRLHRARKIGRHPAICD